jgi:hypothetical protein
VFLGFKIMIFRAVIPCYSLLFPIFWLLFPVIPCYSPFFGCYSLLFPVIPVVLGFKIMIFRAIIPCYCSRNRHQNDKKRVVYRPPPLHGAAWARLDMLVHPWIPHCNALLLQV